MVVDWLPAGDDGLTLARGFPETTPRYDPYCFDNLAVNGPGDNQIFSRLVSRIKPHYFVLTTLLSKFIVNIVVGFTLAIGPCFMKIG